MKQEEGEAMEVDEASEFDQRRDLNAFNMKKFEQIVKKQSEKNPKA